nr:hypothetical protein GCM10020063_080850 [Dactylosporangium thailandense]
MEADLGARADGQVFHGLGDMGFPDADGAVEDDRFAGLQPAQRGEVTDLRGREFRVGAEVEAFAGGLGAEAGAAQPAAHGDLLSESALDRNIR